MGNLDLKYICSVIGNLSGIPIRLYKGKEQIFYQSFVALSKDPMSLYEKDIFAVRKNLGYFITPYFNYYGMINSADCKIIIGPTRQTPASEKALREIAFQLDLMQENADDFVKAMKTIVPMPLDSIMQMLCVINYVLNGEKLRLEDIHIYEADQDNLKKQFEKEKNEVVASEEETAIPQDVHNTLALEQTIMNIVRKGDAAALKEWIDAAPAVRSGILANSEIRHLKNIFIVTATLTSRAAIRGGMDIEDALSLSDSYIQKCELMNWVTGLTNLQYRMIADFTERVERIRLGKYPSKLVKDVSNYVQHHLSESVSTADIAEHLFVNRCRLCTKFKAETGVTLNHFILQEKTEEAKRLLRYSDKTILTISSFLGFSSQSHFAQVFKKYTGKTPNEYRELHNK